MAPTLPHTDFPIILTNDKWWALAHINGTSYQLNFSYTGGSDNNLEIMDINLDGPDGTWYPGVGTVYDDVGWAMDGDGGNDTLGGYTLTDWLRGDEGNDVLSGNDGDDLLEGGDDIDQLFGGKGNDVLYGGDGIDYLSGDAGSDVMEGGAGDDVYRVGAGDTITEQADMGIDKVYVDGSSYTLQANFENLVVVTNQAATIHGNALANDITGNAQADALYGEAGDDVLSGAGGIDTLSGGAGDDRLFGGTGADKLYGGDGADYLDGGESPDLLAGGAGNDTYVVDGGDSVAELAGAGTDTVESLLTTYTLTANVETLKLMTQGNANGTGNVLANTLTGNNFANLLDGAAGNDTIWGQFGTDTLTGGTGDDQLHGGYGADVITGGAGKDQLWGEAGADRFVFTTSSDSAGSTYDTVRDFVHGVDLIDLSLIDANTTAAGNQFFHFAGNKPVFGSAGDLWATKGLLGTLIEGDTNGDGAADVRVMVNGNWGLTANDFLL